MPHLIDHLPRLARPGRPIARVCPRCGRRVRQRPPRPRILPAWRSPRATLNAATGSRLLDAATGKRLLDPSTGKRNLSATDPADCVCCGPAFCTACSGNDAIITLAGITPCFTGCEGNVNLTGVDFSGTYAVPLDTSPPPTGFECVYQATFNVGLIETLYDAPEPCGGDPCDTCSEIRIVLLRTIATEMWSIGVEICAIQDVFQCTFFPPAGAGECPDFPDECDDYCWTKSVPNTITTCQNDSTCGSGIGFDTFYTGGTATITVG